MTASRRYGHDDITGGAVTDQLTVVSPGTLNVVAVDRLHELDTHASGWNDLSIQSRDRIARFAYPYVKSFVTHLVAPEDRWICLFVYDGRTLVAVAPLVVHGQPRTTSSTGANQRNGCRITGLTVLAAKGYENSATACVLEEVERQAPRYFNVLFRCVHEDSSLFRADRSALKSVVPIREQAALGSYLPTNGTFSDYYATLGRHTRRNLRKWEKRLLATSRVSYESLTGNEATDEAFEQFLRLEASGWKGRLGSAIASNSRQLQLYRELARNFREAGWLELHFLKAGPRFIAGLMGIRVGSTLSLLKMGYDEELADCGPGNFLFERMLEYAFATRQIAEVNCLTDMPWQRQWHMRLRQYDNLYLYPARPASLLLGALPLLTRLTVGKMPGVHQLLRTIRSATSSKPAADHGPASHQPE